MTRDRFNRLAGYAPLSLSAAAFLLVAVVLLTGWQRNLPDEGAAAHIWQLLIALQVPLVAAFLATAAWDRPGRVLRIAALQAAGLALAMAPVALFRL